MKVLLGFLCLSLLAIPASAQDRDDPSAIADRLCSDDQGVDRCDGETQRRMRESYGLADARSVLDSGITLRRAMFVDGYGRDVAAIDFVRRPGEEPRVEVRTPSTPDEEATPPLTAPLSLESWHAAIGRSENFDQKLAREMPAADQSSEAPPINLCLHSWVVVVEAVDAPRVSPNILVGTDSRGQVGDLALAVEAPTLPGIIRSDTEDACADGLAIPYAFAIADLAHRSLPQCSTLDLDDFRNSAMLLATCHRLRGDRHTAGEAYALSERLQNALRGADPRALQWLFVGTGAARADTFREAIGEGKLYLGPPEAEDFDRASVSGSVYFPAADDEGQDQIADVELHLLRQTGEFRIDTFAVGERRPYVFPE